MSAKRRWVIDSNVLASALPVPNSMPRRCVDRALDAGILLFSESALREIAGAPVVALRKR